MRPQDIVAVLMFIGSRIAPTPSSLVGGAVLGAAVPQALYGVVDNQELIQEEFYGWLTNGFEKFVGSQTTLSQNFNGMNQNFADFVGKVFYEELHSVVESDYNMQQAQKAVDSALRKSVTAMIKENVKLSLDSSVGENVDTVFEAIADHILALKIDMIETMFPDGNTFEEKLTKFVEFTCDDLNHYLEGSPNPDREKHPELTRKISDLSQKITEIRNTGFKYDIKHIGHVDVKIPKEPIMEMTRAVKKIITESGILGSSVKMVDGAENELVERLKEVSMSLLKRNGVDINESLEASVVNFSKEIVEEARNVTQTHLEEGKDDFEKFVGNKFDELVLAPLSKKMSDNKSSDSKNMTIGDFFTMVAKFAADETEKLIKDNQPSAMNSFQGAFAGMAIATVFSVVGGSITTVCNAIWNKREVLKQITPEAVCRRRTSIVEDEEGMQLGGNNTQRLRAGTDLETTL